MTEIKGRTEAGELVVAFRCAEHAQVGQLNSECENGAECGACLGEQVFASREWLRDARRLMNALVMARNAEELTLVREGAATFVRATRPMFADDVPPTPRLIQ